MWGWTCEQRDRVLPACLPACQHALARFGDGNSGLLLGLLSGRRRQQRHGHGQRACAVGSRQNLAGRQGILLLAVASSLSTIPGQTTLPPRASSCRRGPGRGRQRQAEAAEAAIGNARHLCRLLSVQFHLQPACAPPMTLDVGPCQITVDRRCSGLQPRRINIKKSGWLLRDNPPRDRQCRASLASTFQMRLL